MDGVTAVANVLKMEGVDWIAVMPSNPLIEAAAIAGIRPVVCRQERTGVHMADGFSRITNGNKIGIFLAQNGPGAENSFGGVAQAYADSVPILVLPAGVARNRLGVEPNFHPVQLFDHHQVGRPRQHSPTGFLTVPAGLHQAPFRKPGPVLLEIPSDLVSDQISEEDLRLCSADKDARCADPAAITRGVRRPALRPLPGDPRRPGRPLRRGHRRAAGAGRVPANPGDDHPRRQERLPREPSAVPGRRRLQPDRAMVHRFLTNADTVFGVGVSFTKSGFTVPMPAGKTLIHLTNDDGDINKRLP